MKEGPIGGGLEVASGATRQIAMRANEGNSPGYVGPC